MTNVSGNKIKMLKTLKIFLGVNYSPIIIIIIIIIYQKFYETIYHIITGCQILAKNIT